MTRLCLPVLAAGLFAACAGDNHVTRQSPRESARYAAPTTAGSQVNSPRQVPGKFMSGRVYLVTRLETTDQPRGEWRAQGDTIREKGSEIEFVELGSGKTVSFTAPHQTTLTDARTDRTATASSIESDQPGRAPGAGLNP